MSQHVVTTSELEFRKQRRSRMVEIAQYGTLGSLDFEQSSSCSGFAVAVA